MKSKRERREKKRTPTLFSSEEMSGRGTLQTMELACFCRESRSQ
jgi:hypothetical protein